MNAAPENPFLAASVHAMAHARADQQDSSMATGPTGPTRTLADADRQYTWLGPGHFGGCISGPYPDGRRVVWSNGRRSIVKLDHDTLEVLARLPVGDETELTEAEMRAAVAGLDELEGQDAIGHAVGLALGFMTGLDGVYSLLDCDHTLFLGRKDGVVAYHEVDPSDPASEIVVRNEWVRPDHIDGSFVGINLTFDGRLVMTTDHGWVVCLARDFSDYDAIRLPGADAAAEHCARMEAERGHSGYGWVRTSLCVDEANGIYVSSVDHTHKVVWTGSELSLDPAHGAWSAEYRNGSGTGSGTTPCLMGFGDEDRFVVIGDGDDIVNITLLWRDDIPDDWDQLSNAPSRRIAGLGPAHMGDPNLTEVRTEQSITVAGHGALTVNNQPATVPDSFPERGVRLLAFFLGHHEIYRPVGLHKYEWDPTTRRLRQAWINRTVSSPNAVPFVSLGANLVYTCGTRAGKWTIEALDWTTGEEAFHLVVGDSSCNTLGAAISLDQDDRLVYGTIFGKLRIL